jgi:acetylornithine deacetylase/succinyl-diaminopimelate desuccinylase-like protein
LEIQSVNPPGGETEVARYLKRLFDDYQVPNEIVESSPGRGNFLAYLGEGERSLLYLSHTDVVPVPEGWSFAPFSGEIRDGFVYGRGTLDCKGLVAAEAFTVLQLACSTKLKGRLIFAATADEETGGTLGVKHLVENYKDKIMADFAINEGGGGPLRIGDKTCHFIQIGEKGICRMKLKTSGRSSHGSLPMLGDNAVIKMAEVIKGLSEYQSKPTLIPEVRQLIQTLAELEGFNKHVNEENLDQFIHSLKDRIFAGYLTAVTRMTVSPNMVHGGIKVNIVPDVCEAEADVRVLPGQDKNYILDEFGHAIDDAIAEVTGYHEPTFSTSNSEYYRLIVDTLQELVGDDIILPSISSGSTDSKHLREVGIPCYGIAMMTINLDDTMKQSIHSKNEKIDIDSLRLKSDFLTRLARRYLED